jgi:hypothetical protein
MSNDRLERKLYRKSLDGSMNTITIHYEFVMGNKPRRKSDHKG